MDRGLNEAPDPDSNESDDVRDAVAEADRLLSDIAEGVGEGRTADGRRCVTVMVDRLTEDKKALIPAEINGVPVEVLETGSFHAE